MGDVEGSSGNLFVENRAWCFAQVATAIETVRRGKNEGGDDGKGWS